MTDFEKEEFWKALGRLYDSSVELRQVAEAQQRAAKHLLEAVESHEKRLDKNEKRLD